MLILECGLSISSNVISVQVSSYFANFLHYYSSANFSYVTLYAKNQSYAIKIDVEIRTP